MSLALIGTLAAFILIVYLASRKVPLYLCVLIGTLIVGLSCGYSPMQIAATVYSSLIDPATTNLLAVIALICISSYLLERFALLKRAVEALDRLLPSTKITIMLVPMLIGCLTVAGGAIISAPMVDQLGERLKLIPRRKAAINLLFRHAGHFMFPFTPGIIMAANLGGFRTTELAAMMSPITVALLIGGYLLLLRDTTNVPRISAASPNRPLQELGSFILNASPILLPLVLSIILGFDFTLSLSLGILLAVFLILSASRAALIEPSPDPSAQETAIPSFRPLDLLRGLYVQRILLFSTAGIMIFRGMIVSTSVLTPFITGMLTSGVPLAFLAVLFPFLIGYSSGNISSAIGICWPLLIAPELAVPLVPLAMLMYIGGYLGYFFSPLHLCTVLTNGFFEVDIANSYRDLAPIFVPLPIIMALLYVIFH